MDKNVHKCSKMYTIKFEFISKINPPESIVSASFGNNLFCSCFFLIFLESVRFEEEPLSELHSFTFDPCLIKDLRVGTLEENCVTNNEFRYYDVQNHLQHK